MMPPTPRPVAAVSRRAYLVIGVAVFGYVVAVMHRTSFGVAGLDAADRFGVNATVLGLFVMVQLGVYAGLQIPVGIALDRFGSRALITFGLLTAAVGQLALATVGSVSWALVARVLIGAGDACIFISVLRLLPAWLPPSRVPVVNQLVGLAGQLGQVVSAVPLLALLRGSGWVAMFTAAAGIGAVSVVLAFAVIRDSPSGSHPHTDPSRSISLRSVVREPGTWLGFWTHFVGGFSSMVVVMLWGVPFLEKGEGLSSAQASALLLINTATSVVCGPIIGAMTGRHPLRRSSLVLGSAAATAVAWAALLLSPNPLPFWAITIWMVVIAFGNPIGLIGLDFARTFNRPHELGRASGVVNVGGFLATVISILLVSVVLDALRPGGSGSYDLGAYRAAFATLALPWTVGVVGVVVTRRRARAALAARGIVVPPLREALARDRRRRGAG